MLKNYRTTVEEQCVLSRPQSGLDCTLDATKNVPTGEHAVGNAEASALHFAPLPIFCQPWRGTGTWHAEMLNLARLPRACASPKPWGLTLFNNTSLFIAKKSRTFAATTLPQQRHRKIYENDNNQHDRSNRQWQLGHRTG